MEVLHQKDEDVSTALTPESSPERSTGKGVVCQRPATLPYRLKRTASQPVSPELSPDKDNSGGVRLSPVKALPNTETVASTAPLRSDVGQNLQPYLEDGGSSIRSIEASQSGNLPESIPQGPQEETYPYPLTEKLRFPLKRLPHRFFPDASRSVSTPERTSAHGTSSGTTLDGQPTSSQENYPPDISQGEAGLNEHPPPQPPAYQPRPLNVVRRRTLDKLQPKVEQFQHIINYGNRKRNIHQWLQVVFLDLLVMTIILALTGIILLWGGRIWHQDDRLFPMTFDHYSKTWYGPVELSYPRHDFILSVKFTGFIIPFTPAAIMLLMQIWVRSWLDCNAGLFAWKKAVTMMLFVQTILKAYIGEFRPHFISQCDPDPVQLDELNTTMCRTNQKNLFFAMSSFPSGHTAESFMAGTFLALYLNAKLKPFGDFHTSLWKMVVVISPLLGAMFIAGSLVADRNHHHHDIFLSIPIGVSIAMLAYRTHYASLFNYRTNHLPLPWSSSYESLNPTLPNPGDGQHVSKRAEFLRAKGNFAATAWPRKPKTYSYGNRDQAEGPARGAHGLDGTVDTIQPTLMTAGYHSLRRRFVVGKTGRPRGYVTRMSGTLQSNVGNVFEMRPLAGIHAATHRKGSTRRARVGVDTWVNANRDPRSGRASDMV